MQCDFCGRPEGPQPYKPYWPVCQFTGGVGDCQIAMAGNQIFWEGTGPYLACQCCAEFIDAKEFKGLLASAVARRKIHPEQLPVVLAFIVEQWEPIFGKGFLVS